MLIDSLDTILYTLAFIAPGFVFYAILSSFLPRKADKGENLLLKCLIASVVNLGIWSWLISLAHTSSDFVNHPVRIAIVWGIITLVSPVLFGLLIGHFSQKDFVYRGLQRLGFYPIHPIPTAWDYKFHRVSKTWVLVTLKEGKQVGGVFGSNSFSSSDPNERDLYLEKVYKVRDNTWEPVPGHTGILIKADEINYIEFFNTN